MHGVQAVAIVRCCLSYAAKTFAPLSSLSLSLLVMTGSLSLRVFIYLYIPHARYKVLFQHIYRQKTILAHIYLVL